ncbi:GNAT family N-acetyltransferase [Homoserinibacter sp. GY 40078]|uniref:GNAT family N-acetyltransferase n=1 Tax=Homoserinibacter sp. GY 40078 TaxID=2603275 RepID=UPI0011C8CF06|nr:GNAT family N-acetyltransferase [Homoserinibacter sp. GY 40078]TXK18699.1 N-acetyltransferase [Homoserinibacter sp. GY 40078]
MTDRVVDIPERHRFVLERDGEQIGKALYRREPGVIIFTHTEVDPEIQERGLGSLLAKSALDAVAAEEGTRVVALCPFIASYIEHHPEYQPLLSR